MKINNIKKVSKEDSRIRGIASVLLDNGDIINDIRIIEGDDGLFAAIPMPKAFVETDYDGMDEKKQNEYNKYRNSLKGIDKLVIDEFNQI
jgi:DNA-binding cell septation regulator SpoVG